MWGRVVCFGATCHLHFQERREAALEKRIRRLRSRYSWWWLISYPPFPKPAPWKWSHHVTSKPVTCDTYQMEVILTYCVEHIGPQQWSNGSYVQANHHPQNIPFGFKPDIPWVYLGQKPWHVGIPSPQPRLWASASHQAGSRVSFSAWQWNIYRETRITDKWLWGLQLALTVDWAGVSSPSFSCHQQPMYFG